MIPIDSTKLEGTNGAIWGTETNDLNATVVRWEPDLGAAAYANHEVDVIMTILKGSGAIIVDQVLTLLEPGHVLVIPKGATREIKAGAQGITYLNVHKRRPKLQPTMTRPR